MSLNAFPNELLVATFSWLPSYTQMAGMSRVCHNWKNLIKIPLRANIHQHFPFLTSIPDLSTSELAKLSEYMESLYVFAAKMQKISPHLLFNLKEMLEKDTVAVEANLLDFAAASSLIPLDDSVDKREVFVFAALLGNKEKLLALDKKVSVQVKCSALVMAATCGQLECLQYLDNQDIPPKDFSTDTSTHELAFRYAAGIDSLSASLKPLLKWDSLPCLKYLIEKHPAFISNQSIKETIHSTCQSDYHFSSFKYLCEIMEENENNFLSKNRNALLKKCSPACKQYLLNEKQQTPRCVLC